MGFIVRKPRKTVTANLAVGNTVIDNPIRNEQYRISSINVPSTFSGTTITFTASATESGTYEAVRKDDNSVYTMTVTPGTWVVPDAAAIALASLRFFKLVSGTTQATSAAVFTINFLE